MLNIKSLAAAVATIATLASAAPLQLRDTTFTPPTGNGSFSLMTLAYDGDLSLSGMWLTVGGGHSGAATEEPFFVWDQASRSDVGRLGYYFNTTTGDIYYYTYLTSPTPTTYFTLDPFANYVCGFDNGIDPTSIPANYSCVQGSVDVADRGFSFDATTNVLRHKSYEGQVFGVCPLRSLWTNGTQYGFMTRPKGSERAKGCADVHLKAVF